MNGNAPKTGTEKDQAAAQEGTDKGKKDSKEKSDASKMLLDTLGKGIAGDLEKGLRAYGEFMIALEKLGAVDIMDLLKKGFTVWQVEAEIKKVLKDKDLLIKKDVIGKLATNTGAMESTLSGENLAQYITRCLGLTLPVLPPRPDKKESDPLMVSLVWFKTSGVVNLLAYNAVKDGLKANDEKKPILYENDLVYIKTGENKYTAGFIKDFDMENELVKLTTVENGQVVKKDFKLKSVLMAFHFAGNEKIMPRSVGEAKKDFEPENVPAPAPGTAPTATPGTTPAPAPGATPTPAPGTTPAAPTPAPAPGTAPAPAPGTAPAPAPAPTPAPAPQPAPPSGPAATPPAAST